MFQIFFLLFYIRFHHHHPVLTSTISMQDHFYLSQYLAEQLSIMLNYITKSCLPEKSHFRAKYYLSQHLIPTMHSFDIEHTAEMLRMGQITLLTFFLSSPLYYIQQMRYYFPFFWWAHFQITTCCLPTQAALTLEIKYSSSRLLFLKACKCSSFCSTQCTENFKLACSMKTSVWKCITDWPHFGHNCMNENQESN